MNAAPEDENPAPARAAAGRPDPPAGANGPARVAAEPDRPRQRAGVVCCEVLDELVVYSPDSADAVALNDSAHAIWTLCDGSRTPAQICAELAALAGVSPAQLEGDVSDAIDRLRGLGLLEQGVRA